MQTIICDVPDIDILEANGLYKLHLPAVLLRPDTKEPVRTLAGVVVLTPQAFAGLAKQIVEIVQAAGAQAQAAQADAPSSDVQAAAPAAPGPGDE